MINLKLDVYTFTQFNTMLEHNHFQAKNIINADNIKTVPSKIHRTNGFHINGERCRRQRASGIAYILLAGNTTCFDIGVMAIKREDPLIDLLFEEINQYFANNQR